MGGKLDSIGALARALERASGERDGIAAPAGRLAERLERGRFQIAVVGEFKRWKSTLINALVGEELLPTGVLPLTAVPTEVCFGEPRVRVVHHDRSVEDVTRR